MSEERYSSMDECTLRTLLEATLDLAERRQIRTAIRELRRKEVEGYEEALASKRFRSEKSSELLENKENRPRSQERAEDQSAPNAFQLAKLEAIKDVEELTTLLRTADEYEERKLIRAAIRKLRNEEIEAISSLVGRSRERDVEKMVPRQEIPAEVTSDLMQERDDLEERQHIKSQIRELRAAQIQEDRKQKEIGSDMLFPDPTSAQLSSSTSTPLTSSEESTEECSLNADTDLDLEAANNYRNQNSCNSRWPKNSRDSISGEEDDGREKNEEQEVFKTEHTNGIDCAKEEDAFGEESSESPYEDKSLLEAMELTQKEWDLSGALESNKLNTLDKNEGSKTMITPSVEKTATVSHTSDCPADPSPFRRTHSLRESPKRVAEDSVDQPAFLGSRFGSQRGESRSRGNRILQQQQQLLKSASPAPKNKVSPILANSKGWSSGRQAFDSLLQKRQEVAPKKAAVDTPTSRYGLKGGVQSLSVRQRINESQKQCLSESSGASPSKAGPRATCAADQRHSADSVKGAFIADTGGKGTSSKGDGAGGPNAHKQNLPGIALTGRSKTSQSESALVTSQRGHIENSERSLKKPEVPSTLPHGSQDRPAPGQLSTSEPRVTAGEAGPEDTNHDDDMKTLFTIEIKDGRNQPATTRIIGGPGSQRAELTLGVRSTPFTVTTSSGGVVKVEAEKSELQKPVTVVSNGTEKAQLIESESQKASKLSAEELSRIEEEDVLDKMLDKTTDFEERRLIRTAMRELRQRKRDQREKERDQRLADIKSKSTSKGARSMETTMSQSEQSADGSSVSTVMKTQRLVQSNDGNKSSRTTMVESSYMKRSEDGGTIVQTKASFSSTSKKVGSIFDREEDASSRAAQDRRQAERKKELMAAQSLPKTSATQARKAMIDKLEKESGSPSSPSFARVAVTPTSGFGVPNANSIKQMLLDWCKAKTRGYENVNINNFSSSWSDGMAFCALVHNFFPEAFDFNELQPQNRRKNFDLAFSTAEKLADCPQLLDVDDMVRMREPDWKCVYTYIQEFYRCLVQKGLVKTKQS